MIPGKETRADHRTRLLHSTWTKQVVLGAASVLLLGPSAVNAAETAEPWFRRSLVGLEVGPTGVQFGHSDPTDKGYCARFDGREIVRRTVAAHGEYLVLWVRDGDYAYYNSQLLPKAPGLGDRDPLREAVDEARKHRLPLISYCVVQQGGKMIITGHGGQMDRLGRPLTESTLSELIGATVHRRLDSIDNWVKLGETNGSPDAPADSSTLVRLSRNVRLDWPFLVEGPATVYKPTTARPIGALMKPHRTARQLQGKMGTEWPMSADSPVGPAILVNRLGKGSVLTFAASPDFATASEHPVVEARTLLRNAIRLLHPAPRVQVKAPANVEAVVTDDPEHRKLRVHFIAYNSTPQTTPGRNRPFILPGLVEDVPMFRASLELADEPKGVEAVNPSTTVRHQGRKVEAVIEDIHEVLIVSY